MSPNSKFFILQGRNYQSIILKDLTEASNKQAEEPPTFPEPRNPVITVAGTLRSRSSAEEPASERFDCGKVEETIDREHLKLG